MNLDLLWNKFLELIKSELTSLAYDTWFNDTKLYKLENNIATIIVPMPIHKKHLIENYNSFIKENLKKIVGNEYNIELYLDEEIKNNNDIVDEVIPTKKEKKDNSSSNLIKKYNFSTFVVGNSNKFAHATALSVAEHPGEMYNPLFLYANSGLGKTHLMHAIGNYIEENSNKRILYVTCEQFIQDFVNINRKSSENNFNYVEFFKDKYRNIDVLIIDDIQALSRAIQTQQEFFNTFNTLYNDSKQIIISSDRSPDDLKLLEDRLRTRFCWGLTVNIFPPDFELRKAIIKNKAKTVQFDDLNDEIIEYMASNIGTNVRELEGALTRLIAYTTMMNPDKISLEFAVDALRDFVNKGMGEKDDIQRIQKIVSDYFQISVEDIRSKKRSSNISFPRQIAMYLCRKLTSESFPKIGMEFGGKDHTTVMHSVDKISKEIEINKDLNNIIKKLKNDIGIVQK